jgi:hypothetical protein
MMNKLTTLFAILTVTATLGVAGCKHDTSKEQPAAKPATEELQPKTDDTKPTETKPTETKPAAAADLPAECNDYKAAVEKLASCDKLPIETRDSLKKAYEQTSAAWASVPAEGKAALATSCKAATDAVNQSAANCK